MPDEENDDSTSQTNDETTTTDTDNGDNGTATVKDAEAVLKKNQELLKKLAEQKADREALAAKVADFEKKESEAEAKRLEKRGDYEKLVEKLKEDQVKALSDKDARYEQLFSRFAGKELQLAIPADVFDEMREDFSIILRTKYLKPVEDDGKVIWKSLDGLETIDLATFIPSLKDAHGGFFKADNNPGGDAPGNNGKVKGGAKKRSEMTNAEKSAYIAAHGNATYLKLPY